MKTGRTLRNVLLLALLALMIAGGLLVGYAQRASAGRGHPSDLYAAALIDANGSILHKTLLSAGAQTNPGADTPVTGTMFCLQGDPDRFVADLTLTGTLAGTNPTLSVVILHSTDNGATWQTAITSTTINATVTPAAQHLAFTDVYGTTPVVIGNCFKYRYTYGGTAAAGNFGLTFMAK